MKLKTRNKIILVIVSIISVVAVAVLLLILYWVYQPSDVLDVKNNPFPTRIVKDPSTGNNIVILHVDYCKKIAINGKVRVSYVSQTNEVFLPIADENGPKTCMTTDLPILIPKDLPSGMYKIKFRATYNINPLKQQVASEFESQPFEIK